MRVEDWLGFDGNPHAAAFPGPRNQRFAASVSIATGRQLETTLATDCGTHFAASLNPKRELPSQNSTWLVTSRLDTTRSTCLAHAFWLCRACRTALYDMLVTTCVQARHTRNVERVVSKSDVSNQVEFGLYPQSCAMGQLIQCNWRQHFLLASFVSPFYDIHSSNWNSGRTFFIPHSFTFSGFRLKFYHTNLFYPYRTVAYELITLRISTSRVEYLIRTSVTPK